MDPFSSKAIILKLKAKIVYKKGGASALKAQYYIFDVVVAIEPLQCIYMDMEISEVLQATNGTGFAHQRS